MEFGGSKMHDKYIHYPVILEHIQIHCIRFVIPDQPIAGVLCVVSFGLCVMFRIMWCVVFCIMCSGLCVLDYVFWIVCCVMDYVLCSGLCVMFWIMHPD